MRKLIPLVLLFACSEAESPSVHCTMRVDCNRNEICVEGRCVTAPDAGTRDAQPEDAQSHSDASHFDASHSDAQPRDAEPPHDAGCGDPIVLDQIGYCTVSEAIIAAAPGAVIQLPGRRIRESILINKALTIHGLGTATVLVGEANKPVIVSSAANVFIESMLLNAAGIGIEIKSATTIRDVIITGATRGISVAGAAVALLERVEVSAPAEEGIRVEPGGRLTVSDTRVVEAGFEGILINGAFLMMQRTEVLRSAGYGLSISPNSVVHVVDHCLIQGGAQAGIAVFDASFFLEDSESSLNGPMDGSIEDGLWLDAPRMANVVRNTFSTNRGYGIFCSGGEPGVCVDNLYVSNNAGDTNCEICK